MAAIDVDVSGFEEWIPKEHWLPLLDFMRKNDAHWWHGIALTWNWDRGLAPLALIAHQPDCDRTTATCIFWSCSPDYFFSSRQIHDETKQKMPSEYKLARLIASNLNSRFYQNERFGYDRHVLTHCNFMVVRKFYESLTQFPEERDFWGHPLMFPFNKISEPYDYSGFEEGFPREVAKQIGIIK